MRCFNKKCHAQNAGCCVLEQVFSEQCDSRIPDPEQSASAPVDSPSACSTCEWTHDEGISETECGEMFVFNDGDAKSNGFKFCPYCGDKIIGWNDPERA